MLYYVAHWLSGQVRGTPWADTFSWLRIFDYTTVRSAGAAVTALLLSLWMGRPVINWLRRLRFGQHYADKAETAGGLEARVLSKRGTPTMGGILIVVAIDLAVLLWATWNPLIVLTLLSLVVLAGLGFYDDYLKIAHENSKGTRSSLKLWIQFVLALFIGIYLWMLPGPAQALVTDVTVPFLKHPVLVDAAWAGLLITVLAIMGSSNAVNLTDGLDGLAIGCTVIATLVFVVLTYIAGDQNLSTYLSLPYVEGANELTVFSAAMLGAGLGFLWFNCHPAEVFMGDTGSLALGGVLGIMAVLIHQPFILLIAGGVFVAEAASVLLQTTWFKWTRYRTGTGRRLFLMAPLHHHFERLGWYESKVVIRFYIVCILCAILALSTVKLR
jgi:phospho-N-acetylmuramoyl-pentapeptide-transferase